MGAPYGYQTNTLVIKDGDYTWGDFIRFGRHAAAGAPPPCCLYSSSLQPALAGEPRPPTQPNTRVNPMPFAIVAQSNGFDTTRLPYMLSRLMMLVLGSFRLQLLE